MTIQNRVNLADFVSYSKQRKLQNQNLFQNIFLVKSVQNRAQKIKKVRKFYIFITNCFMNVQIGSILLFFCSSDLCLLCYVCLKFLKFKYLFSI